MLDLGSSTILGPVLSLTHRIGSRERQYPPNVACDPVTGFVLIMQYPFGFFLLGYQWLLRLRVDCMVTFSIPTLPCVPSFPVGSPPFIGQREGAEHTHLRMCTPLASTFLTLPATFRFVALSPSTHAIPFLSCFRFHQRVINTSHASCRLPLTLPLSFVLPLLSSTLYFHTAIIGFVISTSFCPFVLLSLRLGTLTGSLALRLAIIDPHCCLSVIRLLDNFLRLITSWKHYRHALVLL